MDIGGMRRPYLGNEEAFTEDQLESVDPIEQFHKWFEKASKTEGIFEVNAMCLATATREGRPSARMVLLKGYGQDGFKFFTNYDSRKAQELMENPFAALNFYWEPLRRCVRIEGRIERLTEQESASYFDSRPLGSRIGAIVSSQSTVIPSRQILQDKAKEIENQATENPDAIRKPENWGGYIVIPDYIEFWQGQTNRLHDRIRFRKKLPAEVLDPRLTHDSNNDWVYERLAP